MPTLNLKAVSFQMDDNLIILCGGVDEKDTSTKDMFFFNQTFSTISKSTDQQLSIGDKFTGGQATQYLVDRVKRNISFTSDTFIHEIEYETKGG